MKKVLVIRGDVKYRVLTVATDEIAKGFQRAGYAIDLCDIGKEGIEGLLKKILSGHYAFVFSCQGIGTELLLKDKTRLVSKLKMPYFAWLFDDVIYHEDKILLGKFSQMHLFTIDEEHADVIKYVSPEVNNVDTLLHGGFLPQTDGEHEKDIDILFCGDIDQNQQCDTLWAAMQPIEQWIAKESLGRMEKDEKLSVREAITAVLKGVGEEMTPQLMQELNKTISYIDNYQKNLCRINILTALAENGMNVHVCGNIPTDWLDEYKEQICMHGRTEIEETLALISRAKILINPMESYKYGMHERIFTAMLCQTACFTPYISYQEQMLGNRLEYIHRNHMDAAIARMKEIIENFSVYSETILEDNYHYAKENHTWEKRGEWIAKYYEEKYLQTEQKKVSVIVPCYNAEKVMDRCIESLVNQTIGMEHLELIFVDDASTDATYAKLCEWEQKYPDSILVVHCEENGRQGTARNIALSYATGRYIGFVDIDDIAEASMFEAMYQKAEQHQSDMVICNYEKHTLSEYEDWKKQENLQKTETKDTICRIQTLEERMAFLSESNNMAVWDKLYRRELILENHITFPEKILYEDIAFTELVLRYAKKVYHLGKVLYHYIQYEESSSLNTNVSVKKGFLQSKIIMYQEIKNRHLYQGLEKYYDSSFLINGYCQYISYMFLAFGYMDLQHWREVKMEILSCLDKNFTFQIYADMVKDYPTHALIMETLTREITTDDVTKMMTLKNN